MFKARLDEVYSGVAFIQRWKPEQHGVARYGWRSDPADPGPSGRLLDSKRYYTYIDPRQHNQTRSCIASQLISKSCFRDLWSSKCSVICHLKKTHCIVFSSQEKLNAGAKLNVTGRGSPAQYGTSPYAVPVWQTLGPQRVTHSNAVSPKTAMSIGRIHISPRVWFWRN